MENLFKLDALTLIAYLTLLVMAYIGHSLYRRRFWPRTPGLPRLPILGNILQHPSQLQFLQYTQWAKDYGLLNIWSLNEFLPCFKFSDIGPIFSLDLLGQHIVVLNTYKAAADFFGKTFKFFLYLQ